MSNNIPDFWANDMDDIKAAVGAVARGRCTVFARSAGGREIYLVEYGDKQDFGRKANYASACAYKDPSVYANKTEAAKPVVLIVGAVHGGEIEGIAAILNMLSILETGKDRRGHEFPLLYAAPDKFRILIIPCMNPDGRVRVPFQVVSEVSEYDVVRYKHGLWKDGTLADYDCGFRVHPILGAVDYMGGYYNDDGINLCADRLTLPMAPENRALIELADLEVPDVAVFLHTGCHVHGKLIEPGYLPGYVMDRLLRLDRRLDARFHENGYKFYTLDKHGVVGVDKMRYPPKLFCLPSAIHHTCGALSFDYESYEATWDEDNEYSCARLLDCHLLLFDEVLNEAHTWRR